MTVVGFIAITGTASIRANSIIIVVVINFVFTFVIPPFFIFVQLIPCLVLYLYLTCGKMFYNFVLGRAYLLSNANDISDKLFGSGAVETSLFKKGEFRGDDIKAYYCRKCGFMELHRIENMQFPAVTTEK